MNFEDKCIEKFEEFIPDLLYRSDEYYIIKLPYDYDWNEVHNAINTLLDIEKKSAKIYGL